MNGYYCFASMAYVLKHKQVLRGPKMQIMLALIDYTNANGECFPSISTICRDAVISRTTFEKHMPELIRDGHIQVEQRWREDGSRDSNLYRIPMLNVTPATGVSPADGVGVTPANGVVSRYNKEDKDFTVWFDAYGKKVGKAVAMKAWSKLSKEDRDAALDDIVIRKRKMADPSWSNGQYQPNPATYLNQRRWEDEWQPQSTNKVRFI